MPKVRSAWPTSSAICTTTGTSTGWNSTTWTSSSTKSAPPILPSVWHIGHGSGIQWWALGRVDTLMSYSDDTWKKMQRSGAKMLFMGAESGDDETLKRMNKGGKSGTAQTLALVERMKHYGIVPELSFVLGNPPDPRADIESTINFIRKIKTINPATELVLYIYTPVPQEGSILLDEATKLGFRFPTTLDEWASDEWAKFSMRRDGTPGSGQHPPPCAQLRVGD
ncbi:MAG: hypothetical protein U0694_20325 [Anaerolineae bacterium]